MSCNHPQPELCALLGEHIAGREWVLFHSDPTSRQYHANKAGLRPDDPRIPLPDQATVQRLADAAGQPVPHVPPSGPGTELKMLLESLGIPAGASCGCNSKAAQMDVWGVAGCREHREEIVGWLREGQSQWGWRDKLAAVAKAVTTGLALALNPLDPFPSLIDEAVRRAEEKLPT